MNLTSQAKYLIDTNVLVYATDAESLFFENVKKVFDYANNNAVELIIAQQNLLEFITVLTRSYKIPKAMALADAQAFAAHYDVIQPLPITLDTFAKLFQKRKSSAYSFDAYLVATMKDNGLDRIITANVKDFHNLGLAEVVDIATIV